ncbi:hypothetical protein RFI_01857 [Reticulomyxa filosa]|uniref:Uncharacterized protein n=1 Tax=Reticulomyxa filosa TaxID=46433 RepID=X6PAR2_RETFI|nr:hypothetical protein RFI_01857 [Reticulomyxa filosa]|eukprot:ETO35218.1 hypothetical protein RFI_01857 [Reticulomyxa filosa]
MSGLHKATSSCCIQPPTRNWTMKPLNLAPVGIEVYRNQSSSSSLSVKPRQHVMLKKKLKNGSGMGKPLAVSDIMKYELYVNETYTKLLYHFDGATMINISPLSKAWSIGEQVIMTIMLSITVYPFSKSYPKPRSFPNTLARVPNDPTVFLHKLIHRMYSHQINIRSVKHWTLTKSDAFNYKYLTHGRQSRNCETIIALAVVFIMAITYYTFLELTKSTKILSYLISKMTVHSNWYAFYDSLDLNTAFYTQNYLFNKRVRKYPTRKLLPKKSLTNDTYSR